VPRRTGGAFGRSLRASQGVLAAFEREERGAKQVANTGSRLSQSQEGD